MSANSTQHVTNRSALASAGRRILKCAWLAAIPLLFCGIAQAQEEPLEKVQPMMPARHTISAGARGPAGEAVATARDFATFRDPAWSLLTIAQIGAATADGVTSLNALRNCPTCTETGVSRIFVGQRQDAHKYFVAGIVEIGLESFTGHYFRNHEPKGKWYWRTLWLLPQSFSLIEHTRQAVRNTAVN